MRGVGLLSFFMVAAALGACSGKSSSDDDDNGGSAGEPGSGTGGKAGTSGSSGSAGKSTTPQGGSSATGGSGGSSAGTPAVGGTVSEGGADDGGSAGIPVGGGGGRAGAGGTAGSSAGRSGGGGTAGEPPVPTGYLPPGDGDTWQIPTGDPLNSTVPVLATASDGVVIAGASSDPAMVGLTTFEGDVTSEAFVARLDDTGKPVWSVPLLPAGLPWAVAASGDDFVVVAPNLPDITQVSTYFVGPEIYVAKVSGTGSLVYEKVISFEHDDTFTYGMAVNAAGEIYLAGGVQDSSDTGLAEHPIVVKLDASGQKLWEKTFTHTGTQAYANSVAVLTDGDIVITGDFDKTIDFGGSTEELATTGTVVGLPVGFVARLTPAGDVVWSQKFGGDDFSTGSGVAALPNNDFVLAGAVAADLHIGDILIEGEPFTPTETETFPPTRAFVARFSGAGDVAWADKELESDFGNVIATDGKSIFLGGAVDDETDPNGSRIYLRSYTLNGDKGTIYAAKAGDGISSAALAVSDGALWVSGRFTTSIEFDAMTLANDNAGVFLARLKPAP